MKLLEKTRKLSKLLQERDNAQYQDVANLMSEVIDANVYIVGNKGDVK
ncbi:MAG: GTP-sensing pleiotropic transcriptional regulator CodY, partial [Phascolarctobacterium sp.]|nr:GTP-sensing pleiotropic transcriptional regulator CodY [Phascolarctobacterium sp.]